MVDQSHQSVSSDQESDSHSLARRSNLPLSLTSLVGREKTIARISELLTDNRLVTLTGSGGIGKTRLGLEVATATLADYPDGAWLVELAALNEPELVAQAVMQLFGLPNRGGESRLTTLRDFLRPKQLLLVLDNCEHLIAACADLCQYLLQFCPTLRIIATSRETLSVPGEVVWQVSPLTFPVADRRLTPQEMSQFEATRLFAEHARTVQPDFEISHSTAQHIARICRQLDGVPLAIELAAAKLRVLGVDQIADRLDDRFRLLTDGSRTALPRHQTLQATIDWSYNLLTGPEQQLFSHLAVFSGEFMLEAVEKVAADPVAQRAALLDQVLGLLSQLVDKSLITVSGQQHARYRMLETIRRYAWEQLQDSGQLEQLCQQHLGYHLELSEQIRAVSKSRWSTRFEDDYDNFRAALSYALEYGQNVETGMRLAVNLVKFWILRGDSSEGIKWLTRLLNHESTAADLTSVRAGALAAIGELLQVQGEYARAIDTTMQSLDLYRQLDDKRGVADVLAQLGNIAHHQGDHEQGRQWLEESLGLYQELGDEAASNHALLKLADLLLRDQYYEQATVLLQKSLTLNQKSGNNPALGWTYGALGDIARLQGDFEQAARLMRKGLAYDWEENSKAGLPYKLEAMANLAAQQEQFELAAQLWAAAEALREITHFPLPPTFQADYASYLTATRQALGDSAFAAAWAKGQAMPLADAVTMALEPLPATSSISASSKETRPRTYGLTARELEVLQLLATGLTDAQIAAELVISPRTVSKHLQSVYGKLLVSTRSAATRFAVEHHLV